MKLGIHVIADMISQYGNVLTEEEIALNRKNDADLSNLVKRIGTDLQLISLWITLGKGTEDLDKRIPEIQANCGLLAKNPSFNNKLLSKSDATYKDVVETINSLIASYYKSVGTERHDIVREHNRKSLAEFKEASNSFWREQELKKSNHVSSSSMSEGQHSSEYAKSNVVKKNDDSKPHSPGQNGIKAH
jgi:hypothetical protein